MNLDYIVVGGLISLVGLITAGFIYVCIGGGAADARAELHRRCPECAAKWKDKCK